MLTQKTKTKITQKNFRVDSRIYYIYKGVGVIMAHPKNKHERVFLGKEME